MDPRLPHGRPPADYPHDLVSRIKLDEGGVLLVRPILPSDAERLADEIAHADAKTLYMRFFTPHLRLDAERIRYLSEVDYLHRMALVVVVDENGTEGEGVAIGRYEGKEGSDVAEIAVTVKTGWRRSGIGTQLVAMLEKAALARGIVAFDAMYLAGNDGASGLMKRAGFHIEDVDAGIVTVRKELVAGDPA